MRRFLSALYAVCVPLFAFAGQPKPCLTVEEATQVVNKEVCVAAHVYEVVQLPDGTRFLDTCSPETPDANCRFTIVSLWEDHQDVGELQKFRNTDVHIRGLVAPMRGRAGMLLSHARQFNGGRPKFRPNPRLIHGFGGEQDRAPVNDPNLRMHGGRRAFMNQRNKETIPTK